MTKKSSLSVVGPSVNIELPEFDIKLVPAKIDTGADSSTIWASDIKAADDHLSFSLFGPGSQFYTGQTITAADYRTVSVKSSSGEAEFRYKVQLLLRLNGRLIRAWFTLSDRAGMRYPVLLGRRLLKSKFVVDVSQSRAAGSKATPKRVLMLATHKRGLQAFASGVASKLPRRAELVARTLDQLSFEIQANQVVVRETETDQDIADFDLVYFKAHKLDYEFAVAAAQYLGYKHVPFIDKELADYVSYDKLSQTVLLALNDIAVPPSLCASTNQLLAMLPEAGKLLGWPLVCKEISSNRGRKNYLATSLKELSEILEAADPKDLFLLQKFIENEGYLRLYLYGQEVGLAIQRHPAGHADPRKIHLNKPAGGANASLIDKSQVPATALDLAMRAARLLKRQVSGVDMILDKRSGQWYVLEVNADPQQKTGSYLNEKRVALARFLGYELSR